MRIAFVDNFVPAIVSGDQVIDVTEALKPIPRLTPQDLLEGLMGRWDEYRPKLEAAAKSGKGRPAKGVRFRPPVPRPGKIVCMAGNYMESGTIPAPYDVDAFLKSPASVIGDGDTVVLPDAPATVFQHESELGVVIGRTASKVKAANALSHVFGYLNFIDVSARGINPNGRNSFCFFLRTGRCHNLFQIGRMPHVRFLVNGKESHVQVGAILVFLQPFDFLLRHGRDL